MSIADFAVSRRVTVAMLAAAIIVLGVFAIPRLAVALLPNFQPPVVSVTVNYGNVAPETMESTITRPIENAVSRVSGIDYLQSDSYQGQSVIRATFKFGTDINVAAVDIQQQVARISNQLPNDPNLQQPQILKADPNSLPVVRAYVTDTSRTLRDLSDLFTNQLNDEISSVSGVGSVSAFGGAQRAITVEPNQSALAANGLGTDAVVAKLAKENVDVPAGIIGIGKNEYTIRANALYASAAEVGRTVIGIHNGAPVYLGDVARVRDDIQEQRQFSRLDGEAAVALMVNAQPDANVVAVAQGIYAKFDELKRRYPEMKFGIALDQRGFIVDSINALEHTAIYGAVLAVLIILLFLHSWRSTLIVAVSLPISVLGTLFAAYLFHQTLNTMTLGGLALAVGLIVDDAVVVIENIFRHLAAGENPLEAARNGTSQIFSAVLASTITVVTVFVPLLLIPGLQGLIFGPLAIVVMTGVAISLLVAVTTVPMLSSILLRSGDAHAGNGFGAPKSPYARFSAAFDRAYGRLESGYRRFLGWSIDRPGIIMGVGFALFVLAVLALRSGVVATEVFPAADSRFARFDLRMPRGTGLAETDRVSKLVEQAFRKDPRVETVGAIAGTGFGGGSGRAITNQSSLSITLHPEIAGSAATDFVNEWQRRLGASPRKPGATPPPAVANLPENIREERRLLRKALTGAEVRGRTIDILQQTIAQGSDALQIQLFGPDVSELYDLAQGVIPQLAQIQGVIRPDTNVTARQPEVDIKFDRRRVAQYGLSTGDVANLVSTATTGTIASYYQVNGIQYPIVVELPPNERRSYAAIAGLLLTPPTTAGSPNLASIPLSNVADISIGNGPSQISRQNKQRRIDINATVVGRPLGDVLKDAQGVMASYALPSGYRWAYGPTIAQNNDTFSSLALVVLLAIVLIYMLLASQFESYLDPLVIMTAVPLSLVGIVASLVVTHRSFGLTAFIGCLLLVGIAVKNAILVVEFTEQLRHGGLDAREALLQAGPMRLRPILMTTIATMAGMLPLALGIEAGSSTQAPLGTVVIGGLATSTLLSLVVVPALYLWVQRNVASRFNPKPPRPGKQRPIPAPREEALPV
jgi:HAE1 family hydrophobic/amphiphilic exporter-1